MPYSRVANTVTMVTVELHDRLAIKCFMQHVTLFCLHYAKTASTTRLDFVCHLRFAAFGHFKLMLPLHVSLYLFIL